jgi:hypothetical protein
MEAIVAVLWLRFIVFFLPAERYFSMGLRPAGA